VAQADTYNSYNSFVCLGRSALRWPCTMMRLQKASNKHPAFRPLPGAELPKVSACSRGDVKERSYMRCRLCAPVLAYGPA